MNSRQRWILISVGSALAAAGLASLIVRKSLPAAPAPQAVALSTAKGLPKTAGEIPPAENPRVLVARAETARTQGALIEAKKLYGQALQQNPDAQTADAAQQRLGEVNMQLLFSATMTPDAVGYKVQPGDHLSRIAKKFGTTVELIRASNHLRGDLIRAGQQIKVTPAKFSVIVDKSQNSLTLKNGEEVVKVYRCSTGREGITPVGNFKIVNRLIDPVWKGIVAPGHPENPLGTRWLGFDLPQYGIHGTNEPDTIGQPVTQGCVRLVNSDAEELYTLLPEGTVVTVVE